MSKNTLIIDCQLLQTKAWHRGMGKYTAKLLSAFDSDRICYAQYDDIILLFNDQLKYEKELKDFAESRKHMQVGFLNLAVPIEGDSHSITTAQKTNRRVLDEYISENFPGSKVQFLITSLFLDEACPTFPSNAHNSLIYYDLIPLMYYRTYLGLGASEQYFTRFTVLLEAEKIFAISETVANDIVMYLGVPSEKVVNIRGASNTEPGSQHATKPNLAIGKPFILMPTGGDPRKNNLMGVKGFNLFNKRNNNAYTLVITSIFTDEQKVDLSRYSDDILFTGNVSDAELWWLYEHSATVLFPTEYEGLGMPILEAIDADKTIVCSNISVFREISSDAFFMFNPTDPVEMGNALEEALVAPDEEIKLKKKLYPPISELYTWESTAEIVANGLAEINSKTPSKAVKKHVAIVTPNICIDSAEARFAALLYPSLSSSFDVDYYYDMSVTDEPVRPSALAFTVNTFDIRLLTRQRYQEYDLVVYFIANSEKSTATLQAALAMPGLVIAPKSIEKAYGGAVVRGLMPQVRIDDEQDGSFMETIKERSIFVARPMMNSGKGGLEVSVQELAYPTIRDKGLTNQVFIHFDHTQPDGQWNIDFIRDISQNVDMSHIRFVVATRTHLASEVISTLTEASVVFYEQLSDHEYNTLLYASDLYVDARPGSEFNKLFNAQEARIAGLTVFVNYIDEKRIKRREIAGVYEARSGADLRDMTYQWLLGQDIDIGRSTVQKARSLQELIDHYSRSGHDETH